MKIVPLLYTNPNLQSLLHAYHTRWNIEGYAPPLSWVGVIDEHDAVWAAIGFTAAPDGKVVYVSDLLCVRSKTGVQAMEELMDGFIATAKAKGVESVAAQAVYDNKPMRKFIERIGMKPLSVIYGVTREEFLKGEADGRR